MNDFTKEELRILWLCVPWDSYPEIKDKLQYMIDNYCDHPTDKYLDKWAGFIKGIA